MRQIVRLFTLTVLLPVLFIACGGGGGGGSSDDSADGTTLRRTTDTAIRIVHASIDATPISLRIGTEIIQTAAFAQPTFYSLVEEGDVSLILEQANLAVGNSTTLPVTLEDETEYTIFIHGEVLEDDFNVRLLTDQNESPEDGFVFVRFLNGLAGAGGISATVGETAVGSAGVGGATGFVAVPVGVATINFSGATGLPSRTIELEEGHEYTVLLSGSRDLGAAFVTVYDDLD